MLKYRTIYAYLYKKEIKHNENDLEFQWVYQSFIKYILVYIDLHSENKCRNNINSIFIHVTYV